MSVSVEAPTVKEVTQEEILEERVKDGAAYLDEHWPGWAEKIDLKTLDLSSCELCISGQLMALDGRVYDHLERDFGNEYPEHLGMDAEHGLFPQPGFELGHVNEYPLLGALWEDEIKRRTVERS